MLADTHSNNNIPDVRYQLCSRVRLESELSIKKWGETPHFLSLYWIAPILLKEARLARGGIREHEVFLGHEIRSQLGPVTVCDSVSVADGRQGQGAGKGEGKRPLLSITTAIVFVSRVCFCIFLLKGVASNQL